MNDIALLNFNEELEKLAAANIQKQAGGSFNIKIPKKTVGKLGWTSLGIGVGAAGMDAYQDYRVGNSIRKQQGM